MKMYKFDVSKKGLF